MTLGYAFWISNSSVVVYGHNPKGTGVEITLKEYSL